MSSFSKTLIVNPACLQTACGEQLIKNELKYLFLICKIIT